MPVCYIMHMDANITRWVKGGTCGVTEAARILGYSQDTVRRMIEDGELIGWPECVVRCWDAPVRSPTRSR